jgi:hypothetical protein
VVHHAVVGVFEPRQPQVFQAVGLLLAHREDHQLAQVGVGREVDVIVHLPDPLDHLEHFLPAAVEVVGTADALDLRVELGEGEAVAEAVEHAVGDAAGDHVHLGHLLAEDGLPIRAVGGDAGTVELLGQRVDDDFLAAGDRPGAEDDRTDVPLAGGPQAHDELDRPRAGAALVRVRHDRGVEQGGGVDAVLHRQVRPGQQAALGRPVARPADHGGAGVEVLVELARELRVPVGVAALDGVQQRVEAVLGQHFDALEERPHTVRAEHERAGDHATVVAGQVDG